MLAESAVSEEKEDDNLNHLTIVNRTHSSVLFEKKFVRCRILRYRHNLLTFFYPRYHFLSHDPAVTLLVAMRRSFITQEFDIYDVQAGDAGEHFHRGSSMYLATLEFVSALPRTLKLVRKLKDGSEDQLAAFMEETVVITEHDFRVWRVIIPDIAMPHKHHSLQTLDWSKLLNKVGKLHCLLPEGFLLFKSRLPVLQLGVYRMRFAFHSAAMLPSVKNTNLQLCDGKKETYLQIVKSGQDIFCCDFATPLTSLQAFAFGLCQFHTS